SFEQWSAEGENDMDARGRAKAKALLASYEAPALEPEVDEALADFVKRRERELPDSVR
ncbi:MAG TPA: trimethylamine methyltransferase family protein, partial [Aestuariivirgaceae bacterium]|nr:trimethylamine methyltransferase family protein [Aestuariivirgaceae bacterium]